MTNTTVLSQLYNDCFNVSIVVVGGGGVGVAAVVVVVVVVVCSYFLGILYW